MPKSVPSYRHHRPSGQAVVTLNGKDHYLGPHDSAASRTEYDRLIGEWLANGRTLPEEDEQADLRICELVIAYLEFAKTYYAVDGEPGKEFVCMRHASKPLVELYSKTPAREFGPLALKAVRQRWIDRDICRTHINQRVNRIRRIFKWGVENELIPATTLHGLQAVAPLKRGRTPARESEPVKPVPDEHVDAILSAVSPQVAAMIELQRLTGMRPGEVVLIRPCDVERNGKIWVFKPPTHKTAHHGHNRQIFIGPKAQEILAPWMLRDASAYCFSPLEAEEHRNRKRKAARKTPMTPSQCKRCPKAKPKRAKRERYDVDSYRRAIYYGIKKSGCPKWHPHQLRHNCATRMRREFGLDVAQIILGHRSASITEVYAEVDKAKAVEVVEKVG
jgi:integrase